MPAGRHVWSPPSVAAVVALFAGAPFRWWISGCHALELHLGSSWREHEDIDVGIVRDQAPQVFAWLRGWEMHVAANGVLTPWDGRVPVADHHENNIWVRPGPDQPWAIDLTVDAGSNERWCYRRNPAIARPWRHAVLHDPAGVPYLAPDLQLLYKSKAVRSKDTIDAARVIPALTLDERRFLRDHLPARHTWRPLLEPPDDHGARVGGHRDPKWTRPHEREGPRPP